METNEVEAPWGRLPNCIVRPVNGPHGIGQASRKNHDDRLAGGKQVGAIIYCLSAGTFMDANGDGVGDFQGLQCSPRIAGRHG
ncbi:hypothetical protein OKW38_001147 [Paraburkholderia sp. MM5496-R1]|uniref:hypothetical protein n=1 Tax=Paraburkholderia sp. MM5496-R1 TaxID=2991065 RepID=UPI003D224A84